MENQNEKTRSICKEMRHSLLHRCGYLLAVLLLFAVASSAVTYAWISRNDNVNVKSFGMQYDIDALHVGGVKIENGVVTLVDPGSALSTSTGEENLIPGSVLNLKIGLANSANVSQTVSSLGFQETNIWTTADGSYSTVNKDDYDEVPTLVDGNYYYLGTQLTVVVTHYTVYEYEEHQATVGGVPKVDDNGRPVYEMVVVRETDSGDLSEMTPVQMTSVSGSTVTYADTIRNDLSIDLPASHLIAFDIVVTFVETDEEQNAYRDFGTGNAKFSRTLAINVAQQ